MMWILWIRIPNTASKYSITAYWKLFTLYLIHTTYIVRETFSEKNNRPVCLRMSRRCRCCTLRSRLRPTRQHTPQFRCILIRVKQNRFSHSLTIYCRYLYLFLVSLRWIRTFIVLWFPSLSFNIEAKDVNNFKKTNLKFYFVASVVKICLLVPYICPKLSNVFDSSSVFVQNCETFHSIKIC